MAYPLSVQVERFEKVLPRIAIQNQLHFGVGERTYW
jgi:hypothetical protein